MADQKKKKNEALEDLKSIALVLGGVVIGNLIDVGAQKVLKLDKNVPLSGIAEMKKFISPAVRIVGGGAGAYFVPNKEARMLLGGVAVSGAASLVEEGLEKVLKKKGNTISGLGEISDEAIDQYHENMVLDQYDPELPDLPIEGTQDDEIYEAKPLNSENSTEFEDDFDEAEII